MSEQLYYIEVNPKQKNIRDVDACLISIHDTLPVVCCIMEEIKSGQLTNVFTGTLDDCLNMKPRIEEFGIECEIVEI